jgi:hypothetical protein
MHTKRGRGRGRLLPRKKQRRRKSQSSSPSNREAKKKIAKEKKKEMDLLLRRKWPRSKKMDTSTFFLKWTWELRRRKLRRKTPVRVTTSTWGSPGVSDENCTRG